MNVAYFFLRRRWLVPLLVLLMAALPLQAQQTPLTGQMLAPATPASPASAPVTAPAPATPDAEIDTSVGSTTRQLLQMQADGSHAGKHLPIPGQEASASYVRYLKSFEHAIPAFYENAVPDSKSTTGTQ